ncbi:MAG: heat-shock protein, partial [Sphingomonadales bacterium 39-62-4]
TATFKNGVLTVALPRSEVPDDHRRRIPINGGAA